MRTHQEIVKAVGASNLVGQLAAVGVVVNKTTPQRWADRNSIPGEYWAAIAEMGHATLEELAEAASAPRDAAA